MVSFSLWKTLSHNFYYKSVVEFVKSTYNLYIEFGSKYIGLYDIIKSFMIIRDLELIDFIIKIF